jgi:hypothetical protein
VSLVLAMLCLIWWIAAAGMYMNLKAILNKPELYDGLLGYGLLFYIINHLVLLYLTFPGPEKYGILKNVTLFLGTISFVSLFYHWLSLHEIADDFHGGYPYTGMLKMLWTMHTVHLLFFVSVLIYFLRLRKGSSADNSEKASQSQLFRSLNWAGIACGVNGTLVILWLYYMMHAVSNHYRLHAVFVVLFGLILLPYGLMWLTWKVTQIRNRTGPDMMPILYKTSSVAVQFSFFLLVGLFVISLIKARFSNNYFVDIHLGLLWMPLYLYLVLLVYSVTGMVVGLKKRNLPQN